MTQPDNTPKGFSTRAIHHAYDPYSGHGALNPPIYLSSTYTFPTVEDGAARFAGEQPGFVYSRVGNPTTVLLEERIANLEGGEAALVTASGQGGAQRAIEREIAAAFPFHGAQVAVVAFSATRHIGIAAAEAMLAHWLGETIYDTGEPVSGDRKEKAPRSRGVTRGRKRPRQD
jgi:O-acetylhomoserine/O-acetylserine sulfhydrylase-like pyridoxal-dependent enzyme